MQYNHLSQARRWWRWNGGTFLAARYQFHASNSIGYVGKVLGIQFTRMLGRLRRMHLSKRQWRQIIDGWYADGMGNFGTMPLLLPFLHAYGVLVVQTVEEELSFFQWWRLCDYRYQEPKNPTRRLPFQYDAETPNHPASLQSVASIQ